MTDAIISPPMVEKEVLKLMNDVNKNKAEVIIKEIDHLANVQIDLVDTAARLHSFMEGDEFLLYEACRYVGRCESFMMFRYRELLNKYLEEKGS